MKLVDTEFLMNKYNVTRKTIYNWRVKGMPSKKIGTRIVRFDLKEVQKWIEGDNK